MSEPRQAPKTRDEAERFKALGQIAGELIHDLANVVAVVHGRASLALGDARAGRPPTAELERLVESSEDMSVMLRDVLELLRGSRLSPEVRFDPVKVIERSVRRFLDSAPPIEIRLLSSVPAGTLVPGRSSFLSRSVLNLLNNAARYAHSEIRLTLSLDTERAQVVLLVEDDGPGIPEPLLSGVFRPLVSGDAGGAAGLGLSSVAWAIQQLRGEVEYRDDSLLGGAAFEVRLPAVLQRPELPLAQLDALNGRRLVLLEEDASVQQALARLVTRMGAETMTIDSRGQGEEEIMQSLLRGMPDLILLDLRLGARAGGDIWRALRAQIPALAKRVIFLSALAPGDEEWEAARATGQPVIAKPLDMLELARVAGGLLEKLD